MLIIYNIGLPVIVGGLLLLAFSTIKLMMVLRSESPLRIGLFGIWLLGLLTFLTGLLNQVIIIRNSFDRIAEAGDISASIVARNIGDSYRTTISGLSVLILSLILWGIIKSIRDSKTSRLTNQYNANN
jgi:hypothetical protein